jgi:hypothetical protein
MTQVDRQLRTPARFQLQLSTLPTGIKISPAAIIPAC